MHVDVERQERGPVADPRAHPLARTAPASTSAARRTATISKPHSRGSSRSDAAYSEPRMPGQQRARRVDQALLERPLERRAVEVALAVVLLPGVGVGVEQHDADRPVDGGVRAQLAEHDRVVAAERRSARAGAQHRLELRGDLLRGALARCPGVMSRSPRSAIDSAPNTSTSCAGLYGRSSSEASRMPGRAEARARAHRGRGVERDADAPRRRRPRATSTCGAGRTCGCRCSAGRAPASGGLS